MRIPLSIVLMLLSVASVALADAPPAPDVAAPASVRGTLVRVEGRTLIVQTGQGDQSKEVELLLGEAAELRLDGKPAEPKDLQPGTFIDAVRIGARGRAPERLIVTASRPGLGGTVVRVEGMKLILRTAASDSPAKEVVIDTDENTRVRLADRSEAKLADLKPDMTVRVFPAKGTAERIYVSRPVPAEPSKSPAKGASKDASRP